MEKDWKKIRSRRVADSLCKYGLGKERSLQEFYEFIGVDVLSKTENRIFLFLFVFFENTIYSVDHKHQYPNPPSFVSTTPPHHDFHEN